VRRSCTSNDDCTRPPFIVCEQRDDGAFGNTAASTVTETGSPGVDLTDGQPHASPGFPAQSPSEAKRS
jgi:hypothetical protein